MEAERSNERDITSCQSEKDLSKQKSKVEQHMKKYKRTIGKRSLTFTFMHLADAFIQSDFQERALQKSIGH